jgi:hypothetical protein
LLGCSGECRRPLRLEISWASATLPSPWRRILATVEKITQALSCRNQLDISIEAAAKLSWKFDAVTANGFMRASTAFLPFALDDGRKGLSLQSARAPLQPHCGRYQRVAKVRLLLNPVQCPEPGRGLVQETSDRSNAINNTNYFSRQFDTS